MATKELAQMVGTKNYNKEPRGGENNRALGVVGDESRFGVGLPLAALRLRLF